MTRLRQAAVGAVGLMLAGAMVLLGLWQFDVYSQQGAAAANRRAAEPPAPLLQAAPAGVAVADGYGRSVSFDGVYDPTLQQLLPMADGQHYRVLSALRQGDGTVVPVVRGVVDSAAAPPAPAGSVHQTGILLPSEDSPADRVPEAQAGAVRVALLAQQWPAPLVGGFVTLAAPDAQAQGLTGAAVRLPEGSGRLRNGAYAVQWWLFAAFALVMAVRVARDLGRDAAVAEIVPGPSPEPT